MLNDKQRLEAIALEITNIKLAIQQEKKTKLVIEKVIMELTIKLEKLQEERRSLL